MKKIYFMLVLVSVISVLLVSSVYAAGNITVSAEVVEDTVVAEVIVEDNPGIAGYSLLMDFDKSKLVPVSVEQGTAVAGMGVISNVHLVEDLTTLDAVSAVMASTTSMRKNGVMFTVVFDIKDGATGEVELSLYAESENAILNGNLEVVDIDISGTKINLSSGQSSTTGGGSIVIKPSIPNKPIVKPDPEEPEDEPEEEPDDGKPEVPTDKETFVPEKIFADVNENDWFFGDVAYVFEKGLMKGTAEVPELVFSPSLYTNRAMFVTVLYRMEGEPEAGKSDFEDVEIGSYYEKAVAWAAENGIVNGMSSTEFGPMNNITREQTAKIIANYAMYKKADIPKATTDITEFNDFSSISSWAVESLQICADMNIIRGRSDNTIDPKGNTTRAETAAILRRLVEYMEK